MGFGCPDGVWVGQGVSEALGAFVTSLATVYGSRDDRALRLDRRCLHPEVRSSTAGRGEVEGLESALKRTFNRIQSSGRHFW